MTKTKIALFAIPALAAVLIGAMMLPAYSTEDTTLRVAMDIKPGSCPNSYITNDVGFVSVAILGGETRLGEETGIVLNVDNIKVDSLLLMGVKPVQTNYEDVSSPYLEKTDEKGDCITGELDNTKDLTMKFSKEDLAKVINNLYTIRQEAEKETNKKTTEVVAKLTLTGVLELENADGKFTSIPITGFDVIVLHDIPEPDREPPIREPPIVPEPPKKVKQR